MKIMERLPQVYINMEDMSQMPVKKVQYHFNWKIDELEVLQGCVRYIFASFFCMSEREQLQNKEKCFLFHFKSSSCS